MDEQRVPVACFAPPLSDEALDRYQALIDGLPAEHREIKDAMQSCMRCVKKWWELPESQRQDGQRLKIVHQGRQVDLAITPLEAEHVEKLWDVTPYPREIAPLQQLFERLPHGTVEENGRCRVVDQAAHDLRNAAFHLLWHVAELAADREPLSQDKLPAA